MWRTSRSASDGRFDSATSLTPSCQYSGRNPSTAHGSPVDNKATGPVVPYSASKRLRPTKTAPFLSSCFPGVSSSICSRPHPSRYPNTVIQLPRSPFSGPAHLPSDDTSSLASSNTLTSGTTDRLSCKVCGADFTGKYARGNCGRHMRQYHSQGVMSIFECKVDGCFKTFARSDARLKHQRANHSDLYSISSASPINLGEVPVSISTALCDIRTKLDDETYTQLCDMFLYLFPRIVQYLRDTGSNTYGVYMDVLKEILIAVDAIESKSIDSINQVMADPALLSRPPRYGGTASSSKGKGSVISLGPSSVPRTDSSQPSRGQNLTFRRENGSHKVARSHHNESPPSRLVDCPDHKHHKMNPDSQTSPCHGLRVKNMAQVRHHLRRINHQGRPGTWKCPFCKKDFNHEQSMDEHIEAKSCQTQAQSRGDIIKPWAMLYLTRHPDALCIPSPYCDDDRWLPQSMWQECRASLQDALIPVQDNPALVQDGMMFPQDTSTLFSGRPENTMRDESRETTHGTNNIPVETSQAAVHFAIHILNSTALSISNISSATLVGSSAAGFNGDHQVDQNSMSNIIARRHSVLLHDVAQNLESLARSLEFQAQEAWHVDLGQISSIANGAEMVVNNTNIHSQFQLPHIQTQGRDASNSAVTLPAELLLGSSNMGTFDIQSEPAQNESFGTQYDTQYSTPTLSTRSSQINVPTNSYLTQPSPVTNPSSAHGTADRMLLSASNSPHHYRRGSGNSDVSECAIPPRMQPDPEGLLGTNSQFGDFQSIEANRPELFQIEDFIDPNKLTYDGTPNTGMDNPRL